MSLTDASIAEQIALALRWGHRMHAFASPATDRWGKTDNSVHECGGRIFICECHATAWCAEHGEIVHVGCKPWLEHCVTYVTQRD